MKVFLIIALSSLMAFADGQSGNGGDVVTCPPDLRKPIELLDFYEAGKPPRYIHYALGEKNLSVREKMGIYLRRLKRLSPFRAKLYESLINPFLEDVEAFQKDPTKTVGKVAVFVNEELGDLPDSGHLTFPLGCKVEQLIVRKKPLVDEDKLYTINIRLWKQLDNDNMAGAIFHETVYGDGVDNYGHADSIKARYFNSRVSSEDFATATVRDYAELVEKTSFRYFEHDGILFMAKDLWTYENAIKHRDERGAEKAKATWPEFHSNGALAKGVPYNHPVIIGFEQPENKSLQIGKSPHSTNPVFYYPNGKLKNYTSQNYTFDEFEVAGRKFVSSNTWFYPDGNLRQLGIPKSQYNDGPNRNKVVFQGKTHKGERIFFSRSGQVLGVGERSDLSGDLILLDYNGRELVPINAVDNFINNPNHVENQVAYFELPTYKALPLLMNYGSGGYFQKVCENFGFERLLTVKNKSRDGGEFWYLNKENWEIIHRKNKTFFSGYDPEKVSELYCEGYLTESMR